MATTEHRDFNARQSEQHQSKYAEDPAKEAAKNAKRLSAAEALESLRPDLKSARQIIHVNLTDKDTYTPTDKDWNRGVELASEIIFWTLVKIRNGDEAGTLMESTDYGWKIAVNTGRWCEVYLSGGHYVSKS